MNNEIIRIKEKASIVKHRIVYSTNDLEHFINQTYKYRKYFFRNVYLIQEDSIQNETSCEYLELRTFRKVFRCYMTFNTK